MWGVCAQRDVCLWGFFLYNQLVWSGDRNVFAELSIQSGLAAVDDQQTRTGERAIKYVGASSIATRRQPTTYVLSVGYMRKLLLCKFPVEKHKPISIIPEKWHGVDNATWSRECSANYKHHMMTMTIDDYCDLNGTASSFSQQNLCLFVFGMINSRNLWKWLVASKLVEFQ